jgi:NAD-dependent deacetylase
VGNKVLIFSGAGVSAESGLSTFRDPDGLWQRFDHEKICDIRTWRKNYAEVHDFYNALRRNVRQAQPNEFHKAVARWQDIYDVRNVTQNVDDLFERAGVRNNLHVHGFINHMTCVNQQCRQTWVHLDDWDAADPCPHCGTKQSVKPGVVFFHETAPAYLDLNVELGFVSDRLGNNPPQGGTIIVVGTSENVVDIRDLIQRNCYATYNVKVDPRKSYIAYSVYDRAIENTAVGSVAELEALLAERA